MRAYAGKNQQENSVLKFVSEVSQKLTNRMEFFIIGFISH